MDMTKEAAIELLKSAKKQKLVLEYVSIPVAYAISYFFQSPMIRAKVSLGDYFVHIVDVFTTDATAPTAIITMFVVGFLSLIAGKFIISQAKAKVSSVLTEEEIKKIC